MTALAKQIADAHVLTTRKQEVRRGWRQPVQVSTVCDCTCGETEMNERAAHVHVITAAVTATREAVAQALEAVDPIEWALAGQGAGDDAARIARTAPLEFTNPMEGR